MQATAAIACHNRKLKRWRWQRQVAPTEDEARDWNLSQLRPRSGALVLLRFCESADNLQGSENGLMYHQQASLLAGPPRQVPLLGNCLLNRNVFKDLT